MGADTVTPFKTGEGDKESLYEALQYSGLVTEDMTYEEMCNVLANYFKNGWSISDDSNSDWKVNYGSVTKSGTSMIYSSGSHFKPSKMTFLCTRKDPIKVLSGQELKFSCELKYTAYAYNNPVSTFKVQYSTNGTSWSDLLSTQMVNPYWGGTSTNTYTLNKELPAGDVYLRLYFYDAGNNAQDSSWTPINCIITSMTTKP